MRTTDEIDIRDLLAKLWDSKLLIAGYTLVALFIGGAVYFVQPRVYEAKAIVSPLSQTQFATYARLSQDGLPYTAQSLLTEFSAYLGDFDRLMAIAMETGVIERGSATDDAYAEAVARFVSSIDFFVNDAGSVILEVKAHDPVKLTEFVRLALKHASVDLATNVAREVRIKVDTMKDQLVANATKLNIEIDARRQRAEDSRKDEMSIVAEQSRIAHSLGLEKPLDLRAIEAVERGSPAATQINTDSNQPLYLQGYAALDGRIKMLQDRKNNSPYVLELRVLEQQLYTLKNDPAPDRILTFLEQSPLADPNTAMLARFSVASVAAEKVAPRVIFFAAGSLFLGLLVGSAAALGRRRKPVA